MKKIDNVNEKLAEYLNSSEGTAIKTLVVYGIRKSPTEADDNILKNADQGAATIAASLKEMEGKNPTNKEALAAGVVILEKIARAVNKKWLNIIVSLLKRFAK